MDVIDAIKSRKSIRGFKPDPVPREILREILETAIRSPSSSNGQAWEMAVVTGEALEKIKRGNVEKVTSGALHQRDIHMDPLEGEYLQRRDGLLAQLYSLAEVDAKDKEQTTKWWEKAISFFGAPVAIILFADKSLSESRSQFDIALLTQTICLAAMKYDLGTCIEGMGVNYPDVVRQACGIAKSKRMTMSIAIGYPDWDLPVNKLVSKRVPVKDIVTWCGFD